MGFADPAWVIIRRLVSLCGRRLLATLVALWAVGIAAQIANAAALPDSTWVAASVLPGQGHSPVFAIAVDPGNDQAVVAANSEGTLVRSTNGAATWSAVRQGKTPINTIAFDPYVARMVLAGTRGDGAVVSRDGGATWSAARGLEGRNVRVFAFALTSVYAGTDKGVFASADGSSWNATALTNRAISALAVEAIHDPVRLIAGTDAQPAGGGLPLFESLDAGATWRQLTPAITGTMTIRLVAGPLPPTGNVRPLLVGTNTGLFQSTDNGATFNPLSGGGGLPTTDYTQADFITSHHDRFYVASDGGGSGSGGVWRSDDGGGAFTSLRPPEPSVTALAVSNDEQPVLYVATFNPATHAASMWAYHDTGGTPVGPVRSPAPVVGGASPARPPDRSSVTQILSSPQLPYIGLGLGALAVVLTAAVAHMRGRYR